jgi:hypothetical protein
MKDMHWNEQMAQCQERSGPYASQSPFRFQPFGFLRFIPNLTIRISTRYLLWLISKVFPLSIIAYRHNGAMTVATTNFYYDLFLYTSYPYLTATGV